MPNRAIEIHDSVLDKILILDGTAVLHFPHLYIHQSDGTPGVDSGTGWSQTGYLRIKHATIVGSFPEIPCDLHGGYIKMGELILNNEIPIPLTYHGTVELRLESWDKVVLISGHNAELELYGEPEYIEDFEPGKPD